MVPTRQLGIWHKRPPLPSHPPFITTPHPTPVQTGHLSPSLEIRHPALIPRRQRPTGKRQPRVESRGAGAQGHIDLENRHTHGPPCTQYTGTQASPVPEVWEDGFRIRVVFLQALALFYLATEGVETLCVPCSRQQEYAGAERPDPDLRSLAPPPSLAGLLSLAPAGERPPSSLLIPSCTFLLPGWVFSQYQ